MPDSNTDARGLLGEIQSLRGEVSRLKSESEAARMQAGIVASAMDAIIVVDEAQNIVQFNAAAAEIFGYRAEETLGRPVHMLLPERFRESHRRHVQGFAETGYTSRSRQLPGVVSGRRANGEIFPLEITISRAEVDGRKYLAAFLRDISERERLEKLILRQNDSLSTLHVITLGLLNRREVTDLLQFIVDEAVKLLEVSYCEILLPGEDELVAQAFTRNQPFLTGTHFSRGEARLSWQVFDTGKPAVIDDYSAWALRHKIYDAEQFHAAAVLPLLVDNLCIGVLGITRDKPGYKFTEEQILTATRLADIAALAMENSRLYLEVKRLATMDELTGVSNRRNLIQAGEREFQRALRYGRPLSVLMVDVDHFKRVNDTWGHPAGDTVLRGAAQEIQRQIRMLDMLGRVAVSHEESESLVGRFGGEEFALLLPETALEGALVVGERIRGTLENLTFTAPGFENESDPAGEGGIRITVSVGAAANDPQAGGLTALFSRADKALYQAKQSGRNRVCAAAGDA